MGHLVKNISHFIAHVIQMHMTNNSSLIWFSIKILIEAIVNLNLARETMVVDKTVAERKTVEKDVCHTCNML